MEAAGQRMLSSLPLQVALFFNQWFLILYFVLTLVGFLYKAYELPYPPSVYGWELAFLFMFVALEKLRIFLASMGNKTEQVQPFLWALAPAVGAVVLNVYYLRLQTYVLRLEVVLNSVSLAFLGFEVLAMLTTSIRFHQYGRL